MSSKRTYEGMFLLEAGNSDFKAACEPIRTVLERSESEILSMKPWDERRLAYDVKGRRRALYVLTYFEADPARIVEIEHDCRLNEQILRAMVLLRKGLSREQVEAHTPATAKAADAAKRAKAEEARKAREAESAQTSPDQAAEAAQAKPEEVSKPPEQAKTPSDQAAEPTKPAEPAKPADAKPEEVSKPEEVAKPAEQAETPSDQAAEPTEPTKPTDAKPEDPPQAAEGEPQPPQREDEKPTEST